MKNEQSIADEINKDILNRLFDEAKSITIILKKHTHKINNKIIINDNPYPFIYGIDTALSDSSKDYVVTKQYVEDQITNLSKIPKKYLDNDLQ